MFETDERLALPTPIRLIVVQDRVTKTCERYRQLILPLLGKRQVLAERYLRGVLEGPTVPGGFQNHPGVMAADVLLRPDPRLERPEALGAVPCRP